MTSRTTDAQARFNRYLERSAETMARRGAVQESQQAAPKAALTDNAEPKVA